jgi:polysaccharide export outer membrane protein
MLPLREYYRNHVARGRGWICLLIVQAFLAPALHAQTTADGQAASPAPELKPSATMAMRNFEPADNEEYLLGPGDEISVDVPGRPELTSKHILGPDGRISLPVAGAVTVGGMTRDQAGAAVAQALSAYYSQVAATVSIDKYAGNRVLVLGNVEHPGVLYFDSTPTLLEAISRAGMATQRDKPMGVPERCAVYRGNDQVIWIELRTMLEKGNSFADMRLRRNDLVYVPTDAERTVSVLGDVQHPGAVHLTSTSTLPEVLAAAGGLTEHAGTSPKIQIIDPSTGKTREVNFKELLTPAGATEISLHQGEIIFVPSSKFYKITYVMERLNPAITAVTLAALYH